MSPALIESVVAGVARRTGIPVRGILESAKLIRIEPADVARTIAFSVELKTEWRSASATFVPGRFAKQFIRRLGNAPIESRIAFAALARAQVHPIKLSLRANGKLLDLFTPEAWHDDWVGFELSLRRERIVPEEMAPREMKELLSTLAVAALGMVVALAGVDDVAADDSVFEGGSVDEISRRYERKPINREICLALKGRRCWCCGLDFGEMYGPDANGIIEVHHRVPISGMGPGYRVHPVRDLFPVCGNCHTVLHRTHPPEDPDELRRRLETAASRK